MFNLDTNGISKLKLIIKLIFFPVVLITLFIFSIMMSRMEIHFSFVSLVIICLCATAISFFLIVF